MKLGVMLSALAFTVLLTPSCRKGCTDNTAKNYDEKAVKDDGNCVYDTIVGDSAQVYLKVDFQVNGEPYSMVQQFENQSGRKYTFDLAQLYLSNFKIGSITDNGQEFLDYACPQQYLLLKPTQSDYYLGKIKKGTAQDLSFIFGIDSTTNISDPSIYDLSSPLSYQNPSMHWDWLSGYIFMKLEGKTDTNQVYTGNLDDYFVFHIGLYENTVPINLNVNQNLDGDSIEFIHLIVDYGTMLETIDFETENLSHSMGAEAPIAKKIVNQIPASITLK